MTEKESKALLLCLKAHAGQLDKAGEPYVAHPLRVAFLLCENTTEEMFIAALLHDVVEDCGVTLGEIREAFGDRVASAVDGVSRRKSETYREFIERCALNPISRRVKLADIADNTRPERIAALPVAERGITRRYSRAKEYLLAYTETPD